MAPVSPSFRGVECCRVWCAAYCWSYWVSGEGHVQVRAARVRPLQFAKPYQTPPHHAKPNSSRIYHAETSRVPIVDTTVPYRTVPHPIIPFHALSNQFSGHSPCPAVCQPLLVTLLPPLRGKLLVAASCEIQISIHRGPAMGTVDLQHILRFRIILCVVGEEYGILWKSGTESPIVMCCLILGRLVSIRKR